MVWKYWRQKARPSPALEGARIWSWWVEPVDSANSTLQKNLHFATYDHYLFWECAAGAPEAPFKQEQHACNDVLGFPVTPQSPDFSLATRSRLLLKSDFNKIPHELCKPVVREKLQASVSQTLSMFKTACWATPQIFWLSWGGVAKCAILTCSLVMLRLLGAGTPELSHPDNAAFGGGL